MRKSFAKLLAFSGLIVSMTAAPLLNASAETNILVYSQFGREAVFATEDGFSLKAAPDESAREIASVDKGDLLWRIEEDVEYSGWDKINYNGYIVYCETGKVSQEDPTEEIMVTTNDKYYENMSAIIEKDKTALQATDLKGLSREEIIEKVAPIFQEDMKNSGILASVSMAQFILESSAGLSELSQKSNNCFGIKASLGSSSWAGDGWDGVSVYTIRTGEQRSDGSHYTVRAAFRAYASVNDSISDHSAYLAGAMNGSHLRYEGIVGCKDYKKAVKIIKNGGYATSHSYVSNLCKVIKTYDLTRFDE